MSLDQVVDAHAILLTEKRRLIHVLEGSTITPALRGQTSCSKGPLAEVREQVL